MPALVTDARRHPSVIARRATSAMSAPGEMVMTVAARVKAAIWPSMTLGAAAACDLFEPRAQLLRILGQVVEPRELREARQAENALEERRRSVPNRALVATGLRDEAALEETGDGRIGRHAADARDLRTADRPQIRDDRKGLQSRLRETALHGPLDEARTRLGSLARRPQRIAARNLLEHDAASPLAVATRQETQGRLDPLGAVLGRRRKLLDRERARSDHEQRLDHAGEPVDGVFYEAEVVIPLWGGWWGFTHSIP
jgi:hypothetical protein